MGMPMTPSESERAPLQERPDRKIHIPCVENPTEAVADFQARSLRRRFAIGYYLAASVAPLIWGLPR
jgi:hypothetical protein